jgi:hypothetical protein
LPSPPPLRTVRATFTAYGSSLANAPCETRRLRYERRQLHDTPPGPLPVSRGGRTSKRCRRRHLHCLLLRLVEFSRAARPEGSLLPCGWGDVTTPIRPITGRPSLAPSSLARLGIGRPCGFPTPKGPRRVYHVPPIYHEKVRSRLFAGGASSACGQFGRPQPVPLPFGPGLSATLACHQ